MELSSLDEKDDNKNKFGATAFFPDIMYMPLAQQTNQTCDIAFFLNEEVGFKIPTTRSRNNSVFCGALL